MGLNICSAGGFIVFLFLAWLLSNRKKQISWRPVVWGVVLQLGFGTLVFLAPGSRDVFLFLSHAFNGLLESSRQGVVFVFGGLGMANSSQGMILATQVLPFIIVFSSLMSLLFYWGFIPFIIRHIAGVFFHLFKTSAAESLCAAANTFVGIEATTAIKPYLKRMTRSELFLILTVGMSTVASSVMAVYVSFLHKAFPAVAGHLISASILSIPAAFVVAKLMEPETEEPETSDIKKCPLHTGEESHSAIEAILNGAGDGAKLAAGVAVTLIAFIGILGIMEFFYTWVFPHAPGVMNILAYIFYPFTKIMGIADADVMRVSAMLAKRLFMTEIPAYLDLAEFAESGGNPRTVVVASYAICGFAHIASVAIFVGGAAALAPGKRSILAKLGFKALFAATLTTMMTGAVAGIFYFGQNTVL